MFDEFGPRGAEDEREGFWTDLSEVPDEQYRDEDEPKQTQEVIVPPAQEPYGPGIVPPEESGRACDVSPCTGCLRKLAPHQSPAATASPTGEGTYIYTF